MKKEIVMRKVVVKQNEENVIPTEVLAEEIKAISDGIKKLLNGRLNNKALVLLIQHACPLYGSKYNRTMVGKPVIEAVLEGIENLAKEYLK